MSEVAEFGPDEPEPLPYVPTPLDAELAPDDVAAWAVAQSPGTLALKPLALVDPRRLSAEGRVDALRAVERQLSWLHTQQQKLLAVMAEADRSADPLDKGWVREQVACALQLSGRTAADRLALAEELAARPATLAMQERGLIGVHHARALAGAVHGLDEPTAAKVEARVLPRAAQQSLSAFKASLTRALLTLAPQTVAEQHAAAMEQRRVALTAQPDGTAHLWALLPAAGAAAVMTAINALADRATPDDPRCVDQRRADALVQLGIDALTGRSCGELPTTQRLKPAVQVSVALSTLLGLDDQPGELTGHGPIPAALARRIAADESGTWRRLLTDQHGRLLDYGRSTYRPPTDLAEFVIARDRTCRYPHCHRAAARCDIDHRTRYTDGGPTSEQNCQTLCPRHHHLKDDDTGWHVQALPDGRLRWTSPTGHTYDKPAATYPIDATAPLTAKPAAAERTTTDPDPPPF
jgi:hypothetical protein